MVKKKQFKHDPNSIGYTNALLEDMRDELKAVHEQTQAIPIMQTDIRQLKEDVADMKPRLSAVESVVKDMQPRLTDVESVVKDMQPRLTDVESVVKDMQPTVEATFEEVGKLRVDMTEVKQDIKELRKLVRHTGMRVNHLESK